MAKKQIEIPGTERKTNPEVDAAAEAYLVARNKRMKESKNEKAAKVTLIERMKAHGVGVYRTDTEPPLVVTVSAKDDVRVTELEGNDEGDDAADEGDDEAEAKH